MLIGSGNGTDKKEMKFQSPIIKVSPTVAPQEFPLSDENFNFISKFVYKHVGIVLSAEKKAMVYARLTRRIRALHLNSFDAYCSLLEKDSAQLELPNLINAITTNLTRFFREEHHFEHLRHEVLEPRFGLGTKRDKDSAFNNVGHRNEPKRLKIWSAGCSTGEEAYSIAMTLLETFANPTMYSLSVLATDVDTNVLKTASEGVYKDSQTIPPDLMRKYVNTLPGESLAMKQNLKQLISFQQLNFLHEWPIKDTFDAIFCRNVVIYFDKETQTRLFNKMADLLNPGGWLYIGHSESLYKISDRFKLMGRTIYQKIG